MKVMASQVTWLFVSQLVEIKIKEIKLCFSDPVGVETAENITI